jgi:glycine cleavage system H lipoate-binding protein
MNKIILVLFLGLNLVACRDRGNSSQNKDYSQGVIIVNEGLFSGGTGNIQFYNPSTKEIWDQVFDSVNGRPIGSIAQSVAFSNDQVFIVVNNSNKIEIVNRKTFKSEGTQYGLNLPDEVMYLNEKLYVTEWVNFNGDRGNLVVIDPHAGTILKRIAVGVTPSKMAFVNGTHLAVLNSGDSTVSYVNLSGELVEKTFEVNQNPNSIVSLGGSKFAVLCGGNPSWKGQETAGSLHFFEFANESSRSVFSQNTLHPTLLNKNSNNQLGYALDGKLVLMSAGSTQVTETPWFTHNGISGIYGLGYNESDQHWWISDAKDFSSKGMVYRVNKSAALADSFATGIVPRNFGFLK